MLFYFLSKNFQFLPQIFAKSEHLSAKVEVPFRRLHFRKIRVLYFQLSNLNTIVLGEALPLLFFLF